MTDEYIENNFEDIINHASDIENRLDDSDCNVDWIKKENQSFIDGFKDDAQDIILIKDDYENTINSIFND
jgi:hypothetical protein